VSLRRWGLSGALALAALQAGPGGADAGADPNAEPAARPPAACLERPIVVGYLHHLQDDVMDRWVVPDDTASDQAVVVRFRLAEDGTFLTYKLVSSTSHRLANSVELAVRHAGPFGPVPESATCVIGRPIEMRFENPY
jgi:hypothetical protein